MAESAGIPEEVHSGNTEPAPQSKGDASDAHISPTSSNESSSGTDGGKEVASQPAPDGTEAVGASTGGGKEDSESALGKDKDPTADPKDPERGSSQEDTTNKTSKTQSKPEESADTEKKATESSKPENSGTEPSQPEASGTESSQPEASGTEPSQPEASGTEPSQPEASGDSSDHPPEGSDKNRKEQGSRPETSEVKGTSSRPETLEVKGTSSRPETLEVKGTTDQLAASGSKSTGERRSRRRSRRSVDRSGAPSLRRRTSRLDSRSQLSAASGVKHLEIVILSVFQPSDPEGTGYIQAHLFWELLQSSLQLSPADISQLQALIPPDQSGLIPYAEFASHAVDYIASLHTNQPPTEAHWVELATADGGVAINYNKQTGEVMDRAESSVDVFAGVIEDLYQRTDSEARGYINWKMFKQLLQSVEMSPFLQEQDLKDMQDQFKASVPNGKATFDQFRVLARELILRVYRAKDPSDNPWCKISSPEFGEVWFNKFSGITHRGLQTGDSREHEIAFVNEAYAKVEEINFELEQFREQNLDLSNQLAKSVEDQEVLAAQLYDTGRALDEANNEIIMKENELDQMAEVIRRKDQQADLLQANLDEMEVLKAHLADLEQELQNARDTVANRDSSITERDANIMNLRKETEAVADTLKTAHGEKDAKDSALSTLQHQFQEAQRKLKDYERAVPELESDLSAAKEQVENSKHSLEEKTVALIHARKHLKNARERNMVLEKEMEKLGQTHEKLCSTESEIRTLKTFLTTKTALIEKHKKDLRETRLRVAELEEKDARRAVILADVLEKTARQYQQQLGQPPRSSGTSPVGKRWQADFQTALVNDIRPCSAPAVPPDGTQWVKETDIPPSSMAKSFTTGSGGPILTKAIGPLGPTQTRFGGPKIRNRSRTVPKLPPITRARGERQQRASSFIFPTGQDLRRENKLRDVMLIEHTPSNPQCACELCRMNATVVGNARRVPETGLTGMSVKTAGFPGYQGETDVRELALAEQLRIGQRVLVRMKKSEFDLEPTKLTGIIKYVGKIDSEYVDHRIYVGIKLDEAVGDTDGLVKSKRYFTCPAKHGKIVRITNVMAVLPHKSVFYKSLQEITKRSPYTTMQKKLAMQA